MRVSEERDSNAEITSHIIHRRRACELGRAEPRSGQPSAATHGGLQRQGRGNDRGRSPEVHVVLLEQPAHRESSELQPREEQAVRQFLHQLG
jgi:hypothetical protein